MGSRTKPSGKSGFVAELKRRNVFRAAAIYIAATWALAQGIAQLAPVFNAPTWLTRWFVVACVLGFPFWVAFAWYYELTPEGLKRESEIDRSQSLGRKAGRKLDFWIMGVMAVAIVLLATNQFVLHRDATGVANTAAAKARAAHLAAIPYQSVAVLPLANESGDPNWQYFSDGLTEELISDLTQVSGLKVIGEYSSFRFRGTQDGPAQIGATLGVAHLIRGSVQRQGDFIRVIVSMISAKDGASVWSHSYDEQLKDVFAIQTKIGSAVVAALKIKLMGKPIVNAEDPPNGNVQAYEMMLQGRAITRRGTEASIRQGITLFQQALKHEPNYAYVWGLLSNASVNLGVSYLTGDARRHIYAQARAAADKEQRLAPDAGFTHTDRGYLLATVENNPVGALAEYKRGLALAPNNTTSMNFVAGGLVNFGQLQQAVEIYQKILATDPLRVDIYYSMVLAQLGQRDLDAAEQTNHKAMALQADFPGLQVNQVEIDVLRGSADAAKRDAAKVTDPVYGPWARALAQQIGPDQRKADASLHAYIAKSGKHQPYLVADLYALRKQPDPMFDWLHRAWIQHDPVLIPSLLSDPFVLAYQHDPRFDALRRQVGLPLPDRPLTAASAPSVNQ